MPEAGKQNIKAAILGARGYVGVELIQLLDQHPKVNIAAAYSRTYAGQKVQDQVAGFSDPELTYQSGDFEALANMDLDVLFLALPDGVAKNHQQLWRSLSQTTVIIDLSADHRFDDSWIYGQPETREQALVGARLVANPGCYATGIQLGLKPLLELLGDVPSAFGVSGYSGAGTSPSDKNDSQRLADNLLAYKPTGHTHEKEVSHVLQHTVRFMPHVASHFRGIHLTLSGQLQTPMTATQIQDLFTQAYAKDALIQVQSEAPEIQQVNGQHSVIIGGFATSEAEPDHFVLNVCLDNLLKGAATQAVQNMNLACQTSHQTQRLEGIFK